MLLPAWRIIKSPWPPSKLTEKVIFEEFRDEITKYLTNQQITDFRAYNLRDPLVRNPATNLAIKNRHGSAWDWHQDWSEFAGDTEIYLFLWSNIQPTLLWDTFTQQVIQPPVSSLLVVDNERFRHRVNIYCPESKDRWFARTMMNKKPVHNGLTSPERVTQKGNNFTP